MRLVNTYIHIIYCHPQTDGGRKFLCQSAQPTWEERIYSHPQTDCFLLSELLSVSRHAGRSKPGSKPIQLNVTLSALVARATSAPRWLRGFLR